MARAKNDSLMTAEEVARTFGDRTVLDLETLVKVTIPAELRLARLEIIDGALEDQISLDTWADELMQESRKSSERIREILRSRSETIGMKIR